MAKARTRRARNDFGANRQGKAGTGANLGFEQTLWLAADKLRSNLDAAEYRAADDTAPSVPCNSAPGLSYSPLHGPLRGRGYIRTAPENQRSRTGESAREAAWTTTFLTKTGFRCFTATANGIASAFGGR